MKPIELSQEQRDQIIEMATAIFPQDKFSWEYEMHGRNLKMDFNDVLAIRKVHPTEKNIYQGQEYNKIVYYFNIHWLEFCLNVLGRAIQQQYRDKIGWVIGAIFLKCIMHNEGHVVDALYKIFQRIQTNENQATVSEG
jgi:hypothetical protein